MLRQVPASHAEVATDRPSPYLKQLCKHFRHKHPAVAFSDEAGTLPFPFGTCRLRVAEGHLSLQGEADDEPALAHLERVVGGHLERFGRRDGLTVTWKRGPASTQSNGEDK